MNPHKLPVQNNKQEDNIKEINKIDLEQIKKTFSEEKSARGFFISSVLKKISDAIDEKEKNLYKMVLNYGLDSFSDKGVKKLW